ncbi:aldehyde dehydrogenase family protein [Variovorax sp. J22P168]|uniref:aldehyde dehydrogenase family protein n=1 Tax=Variovorax jilinensis TaxID=3053513 RepID=UPI002578C851|nr:aldehyde dehydrogenase family protein [Variovorax sp. J22P168]MDM0015256.1 aldehyde dehydrogenase family protein [Variovorax sp. J22P168]
MTLAYRMLSNGRLLDLPATLPVLDPATEKEIARVPDCTAELLDATVQAARSAFPGWRDTPYAQRAERLLALAARIKAHADELALLITQEQGRPLPMAKAEVSTTVHWLRGTAQLVLPMTERIDAQGVRWTTRRVPLGVVAAIAPWNFPLTLAAMKLGPALLAGNTLILKPSPFTPLATLRLGELAADLFPPGVLNVLTGGDALGPMITAHPGIAKVGFTGSTATGRRVMASAAPTLKHLTLELGGNDAAVVLPDADPVKTARRLFMGAFLNSGQVCIAAKRIYVHESIYDRFATAFAEAARATRMGPGTEEGVTIGPIQNRQQYERVKSLIEDCRASGHRFLAGGDIPAGPGYFIPPTVLDNPPEDSRIVQEEPFGPVVPLLRYASVDEAVQRANATEYGLGALVWSNDVEAARAVAARLEAGTVWINALHLLDPQVPFAGRKQSGLGVENGVEGLLAYTAVQTLVG